MERSRAGGTSSAGRRPAVRARRGLFGRQCRGRDHLRRSRGRCSGRWHTGGLSFAPDGTFNDVSVGGFRACGIRPDQTLACWNDDEEPTPAPQGSFTAVSVGLEHACAVGTDEALRCWGSNSLGQATPPTGAFAAVSVGELFACGLRTDGTLACWGDDHYLQSSPPGGTFTSIDADRRHACAIPTGGGIVCWGQDRSRQVTPRPTANDGQPARPRPWTRGRRCHGETIALAPVVSYDVRYRRLRLGAKWGPWTSWRTGTTAVGGSLPLAAGRLTCVEVRAHDSDGRVASWSNPECTSAPFDDRSLGRSGRWRELSDAAFYRGPPSGRRPTAPASAWGRSPNGRASSLVATTCPSLRPVRISGVGGARRSA